MVRRFLWVRERRLWPSTCINQRTFCRMSGTDIGCTWSDILQNTLGISPDAWLHKTRIELVYGISIKSPIIALFCLHVQIVTTWTYM